MTQVTIAICTYNRAELLRECLQSLQEQDVSTSEFAVMVVDNNSTDGTQAVARDILQDFPEAEVLTEKEQGLSAARNCAWKNCKTEWIAYLDDDAKAAKNYVSAHLKLINTGKYEVFGGVYLPWYKYGKPDWFKDEYGSNKMSYETITALPPPHTLSGGVMAFKTSLLEKYGGFKTDLGMKGGQVAYGEESELQMRMRADGIKLYYDPDIIIYHLVAKYKLSPRWFLERGFHQGRDTANSLGLSLTFGIVFKQVVLLVSTLLWNIFKYTPKLLSQDYFYESWLIDVFRKPIKRFSILYHLSRKSIT